MPSCAIGGEAPRSYSRSRRIDHVQNRVTTISVRHPQFVINTASCRKLSGRYVEKYPHFNYVPDGPPNNQQRHLYWRFFDCMIDPDSGRYLYEDYTFCRLWRDIGGKVFVDVQCKLMHLGQHVFRGDLAESQRVQGRWSSGSRDRFLPRELPQPKQQVVGETLTHGVG
jgi:hypothetical protein